MGLLDNQIPKHIAIIMDGNGRWAKKRFLPRIAGHKKGVDTIKQITIRANELGVQLLTVYAFSTENWGRPKDEVNFLMKLPKEFFASFVPQLIEHNIKVELIGDLSALPEETQTVLQRAMDQTAHCTGLVLNFALNYGSRREIVEAVQSVARRVQAGEIQADAIDEAAIESALATAKFGALAAPDLLIRTSGEQRLSNFLLWQVAYSEFYFTDTLWPDFTAEDFDRAIEVYQSRQRRFGKV
ncbi:isoprenyl transferase [Aerococcaceae bacterium NML210727]|nr:isoprenyl transferase [Aerococcaceae bacterium NML210727]MCW6654146.1 isoprenyl transferase [Aerococcaceae bacterium NML201296]MCW6661845.1 isoprenyl transferase [Aerococcaceae bacterium NML201209]MCW6665060.1 isoprenyl transferase [Aerococcaceae bacterium NML191219]MCW6666420.1 isoprenyl transferase [Aerococcaceae bacterium NML190938]